jgi:hypothetical protein
MAAEQDGQLPAGNIAWQAQTASSSSVTRCNRTTLGRSSSSK